MVASDLRDSFIDPVLSGRALGFDQGDRNPVHNEENVRPVGVKSVCVPPLLSYMKNVVRQMLKVDQRYISFPFLANDRYRSLASKPRENLGIALDIVSNAFDSIYDRIDTIDRYNPRIKRDEFVSQDRIKKCASLPAPQC